MTKHTIEDLERMYNMPDNKAEGEAMPASKSFKFEVGQDVHNTIFGYNAKIMRRIRIEDVDSTCDVYDLALWEVLPPTEDRAVPEIYLKAGHRVE